jgi:hypothetical protein
VPGKILPGKYKFIPPPVRKVKGKNRPLRGATGARFSLSCGRRSSVRRKRTRSAKRKKRLGARRTTTWRSTASCRTGRTSRSNGTGRNKNCGTVTGRNRNFEAVKARNSGARWTGKRMESSASNKRRMENSVSNKSMCADYTWAATGKPRASTARSKTGSLRSPRRTAAGSNRNGPFRPGARWSARNRPGPAGQTGTRPNSPGSSGRGKSGNSTKNLAGPAVPMRMMNGGLALRIGFQQPKDSS